MGFDVCREARGAFERNLRSGPPTYGSHAMSVCGFSVPAMSSLMTADIFALWPTAVPRRRVRPFLDEPPQEHCA